MLATKNMSYRQSDSFHLTDIQFDIKQGEIISLIGPNGSGKSTLLRLISRLCPPDQGQIVLDGQNIAKMDTKHVAKVLAMLPQIQDHQLDLTVNELIEFGRYPHRTKSGLTTEDLNVIEWALDVTRMKSLRHRLLHSLSGGERQRAWIAMAIAQRPKILLLDEPTTYLDISHQLEVMELIETLNREFGMTVVMVLHDINQAAQYSDRLIVLKDGRVQYDGKPQTVLCREMFQSIFEIDADIYSEENRRFFTPKKLIKDGIDETRHDSRRSIT